MKNLYIVLVCSLLVIGYFTLQAGINAVQQGKAQQEIVLQEVNHVSVR